MEQLVYIVHFFGFNLISGKKPKCNRRDKTEENERRNERMVMNTSLILCDAIIHFYYRAKLKMSFANLKRTQASILLSS